MSELAKNAAPWRQAEAKSRSPWRTLRVLAPWLVSATIVAYLIATQNWSAVASAFARADLLSYLALLACFAVVTLLLDGWFLSLSFRWLAGIGSYRSIVVARGAAYLLTIVNAFVGLGGLVVYVNKRWGTPYARGSGIMLSELLHEVGSLGALAIVAALTIPDSIAGAVQVRACGWFGLGCVSLYVVSFAVSRVLRRLGAPSHAVLGVIGDTTTLQFGALFGIKLVQNIVHGAFVVAALGCFSIRPPQMSAFGLSQIVRTVRGLPVSAFGIGVDQLSFPALFASWDDGGAILAFSIAYTFSMVAARGVLGLVFLRPALAALDTNDHESSR